MLVVDRFGEAAALRCASPHVLDDADVFLSHVVKIHLCYSSSAPVVATVDKIRLWQPRHGGALCRCGTVPTGPLPRRAPPWDFGDTGSLTPLRVGLRLGAAQESLSGKARHLFTPGGPSFPFMNVHGQFTLVRRTAVSRRRMPPPLLH